MNEESVYLPSDIRDRIQDLMKSRKVTQAELATRIGCSENHRRTSGRSGQVATKDITHARSMHRKVLNQQGSANPYRNPWSRGLPPLDICNFLYTALPKLQMQFDAGLNIIEKGDWCTYR